jgi:predicted  nucleic acid-binding Zn-ribbon protein
MGPTNVALVKLYKADQKLREAQARLDAASKDVRVQQRRVDDLAERHRLAQSGLMDAKTKASAVELDLKSRDGHIEKLRTQQQNAKNNKEYQAFLVEINTEKLDKGKIEESLLKLMEQVEKSQTEVKELAAQLEGESSKLGTLRTEIGGKLTSLQAEIEALKAPRAEAAAAVPPKAREAFERLAEHHEGEALSAINKPDRRREEYICSACNMELVTDVYNKLHSRDEMVFCPSCRRILYIPEDLPPETAVHKKKVSKPRKPKEVGAAARRGESAMDVLNSVTPEPEEPTPDTAQGASQGTDTAGAAGA